MPSSPKEGALDDDQVLYEVIAVNHLVLNEHCYCSYLSQSFETRSVPMYLVSRPEPTIDQLWEELRLVAAVKVAFPGSRDEMR